MHQIWADIAHKRQKSAGDDESTLALKLMGRVVRSRGYQWPHKKGPRSNKNLKKKVWADECFPCDLYISTSSCHPDI